MWPTMLGRGCWAGSGGTACAGGRGAAETATAGASDHCAREMGPVVEIFVPLVGGAALQVGELLNGAALWAASNASSTVTSSLPRVGGPPAPGTVGMSLTPNDTR